MTKDLITVYRPNMRHELGFFQTWAVMSRNVWGARELVWQLFKRDLLAGYKKSFMGFAWMFIFPVVAVIPWIFLNKTGMFNPGDVGVPYPVYVLVGTSMWGLFTGLFGAASSTLTAGQSLVMQVKFPHEAMLFKQTAQHLATFSITLLLNVIALFVLGVFPSVLTLLLPIVALPLFFLAAATGLMLAMIAVVAVDISNFVGIAMRFLMYAAPIIYSSDIDNRFVQAINKWNPLTYLVCSCRDIMLHGRLYHPTGYFMSAGLSLLAFMISWRLFYVSEDKIIERMV